MFLPYDYEEYEKNVGFAVDYNQITPGAKPKNIQEFKEALFDMKNTDSYREQRKDVDKLCNDFRDSNCKRLVELLQQRQLL